MAFLGHYRHLTHSSRVSRADLLSVLGNSLAESIGRGKMDVDAAASPTLPSSYFSAPFSTLPCTLLINLAQKKIDTIICILGTFLQNFKRNEQDLTSVQSLEHSSLLLIWLVSCFVMQYLTQFLIFLSQNFYVGRFSLHQSLCKIWVESDQWLWRNARCVKWL